MNRIAAAVALTTGEGPMRWVSNVILCLALPVSLPHVALGEPAEPFTEPVALSELVARRSLNSNTRQSGFQVGSLSGIVLSTTGGRLPGATITVTEQTTGQGRQTVSGDMGIFRLVRLEAGRYDVTAELAGFRSAAVRDLVVRESNSQTVTLTLEPEFAIEDEITVIGTAPQYSLEASEIRESPSHDIGEALARRPGVWRVRKGGIANDIVLRGFQGRDLNVLIDGQRVYGACPNNMDPATFHVDFAEVERVDFSKGPFDVKNEGGQGGSVSIVTRRPDLGRRADGNLSIGAFGFVNPSAYASFSDDRFSILGGYSYRVSNVYEDGAGRKFTELTNYRSAAVDRNAFQVGTAWSRVGLAVNPDHYLQVSYSQQRADDVLYPYLQMDAVYDDTERFGFRWDGRGIGDTKTDFSVQAYYTEVSHWMTDAFRTSATGPRGYSLGSLAATRALGGRFEAGLLRNWTLGMEVYRRFWGVTTEMVGMGYRPQYSLPDVDVSSIGVYAEYLEPLSDAWSLSGGIRFDRVESRADEQRADTDLYFAYHGTRSTSAVDAFPSGNLRIRYKSAWGLGVGFGGGSAAQVPEPTERYFALKRMGSDWVGNPDLRPSRNNGIEGSVSLERGGLFVQSDLFVNWVSDFVALLDQPKVAAIPGITNSFARSYANADARLVGSEITLALPLHDRVFLTGDLSYVRGTKTPEPALGLNSPNLAEIPPLRVRAGLRYDDGRFFGAAEGLLSAAQHRTDLDLHEEATPSYAIMNLNGGVRRGPIRLTAGVGNLFNRNYTEHLSFQRDPFRSGIRVPEPGRNFFLNLGASF